MDDVHNPSESVVSMFENFKNLQEIGTAPKFLINFLEDSLYSVLGKSLSLVELVSCNHLHTLNVSITGV